MPGELEKISAADFFYRNRALAGFDNPTRATYTTVRELVENALDACELDGTPPDVEVTVEKLGEERGGELLRITVADNGPGLDPRDVPLAFGKILVSSKYRLIQSRGTFGLGGKMALLYAQITTNRPFRITTHRGGREYTFTMKIDIRHNRPMVIGREERMSRGRGLRVELTTLGDYSRAGAKIREYFAQTAIITPYANLRLVEPDGRVLEYRRVTRQMPPPPREAKYHPLGIDYELLKRLISSSRSRSVLGFLTSAFQRVGRKTAIEVLAEAGIHPDADPRRLSDDELHSLFRALTGHEGYSAPDARVLSPLGPDLLVKGIQKELSPEFATAEQRKPTVVDGHPVIVETAIAWGGGVPPGVRLYRFANRIPLLYDASSDVSYLVMRKIDWSQYGVKNLESAPLALFIHVVSTKVPFKTVGKEYLANKPELAREIELAWRTCARRLRSHLSRKARAESKKKRLERMRAFYEVIAEELNSSIGRRVDVEPILRKLARR